MKYFYIHSRRFILCPPSMNEQKFATQLTKNQKENKPWERRDPVLSETTRTVKTSSNGDILYRLKEEGSATGWSHLGELQWRGETYQWILGRTKGMTTFWSVQGKGVGTRKMWDKESCLQWRLNHLLTKGYVFMVFYSFCLYRGE